MARNGSDIAGALDAFHRHFTVVEATSDEMRDRIFRLRYQVYCVEHAFEDAAANPDGREIDEFDAHSVHAALIHNESGELAGGVRLIMPRPGDDGCGLPVMKSCTLTEQLMGHCTDISRVGEISRYAISKQFRRRRFEKMHADIGILSAGHDKDIERRIMPFLTLGLIRGVYDLSVKHGVDQLVAIMDPLLLRLMKRMSLEFAPVGPLVNHHGMRQPCTASVADLEKAFSTTRPDMFRVVQVKKMPPQVDEAAAI